MRVRRAAAVLLTCALAGAGCSAQDGDNGRPQATVGQVVVSVGDVAGEHLNVVLPVGELDFTVSKPSTRLDDATAARESLSTEAPDDASFVGISWDFTQLVNGATYSMRVGEDVKPSVTLVADGREYPLEGFEKIDTFGVVVAVEGKPDELELNVEYDGLTQSVGTSSLVRPDGGPATRLYDNVPSSHQVTCPEWRNDNDARGFVHAATCQVTNRGVFPYDGELGWAPAGQAWAVVDVSIDGIPMIYWSPGKSAKNVGYEITRGSTALTLDGTKPARVDPIGLARDDDEPGDTYDRVVFSVPEDATHADLSFARRFNLAVDLSSDVRDPDLAGYPTTGALTFRRTVPLDF